MDQSTVHVRKRFVLKERLKARESTQIFGDLKIQITFKIRDKIIEVKARKLQPILRRVIPKSERILVNEFKNYVHLQWTSHRILEWHSSHLDFCRNSKYCPQKLSLLTITSRVNKTRLHVLRTNDVESLLLHTSSITEAV